MGLCDSASNNNQNINPKNNLVPKKNLVIENDTTGIFAKYNILIYLCIETNTKYTMFGFESTPSKLSGSLAREARAKMKRVRNNCLTDSEKEQVARNIAGIKKYNVIWK